MFPNRAPWPGRFRESIPCLNFRCRTRTRVAKKRPASHTHALGELFIPDQLEKAQGGSEKNASALTGKVPAPLIRWLCARCARQKFRCLGTPTSFFRYCQPSMRALFGVSCLAATDNMHDRQRLFRPSGARPLLLRRTHGLRRGLHSFAATRLLFFCDLLSAIFASTSHAP